MLNFLLHLFTGKDNQTFDLFRVLSALAILAGIFLAVYCTLNGIAFDIQNYGIGSGALLASGGAALKLKEGSEP